MRSIQHHLSNCFVATAKALLPVLLGIAMVGCASPGTRLDERDDISLRLHSTRHLKLIGVRIYQQDDGTTVVTGAVRRHPHYKQPVYGHVDVIVVDNTGRIIAANHRDTSPRRLPTKGAKQAGFRVRLPVVPPSDSQVNVRFRYGLARAHELASANP